MTRYQLSRRTMLRGLGASVWRGGEREQDWNSNRQALHWHALNQEDAHLSPTRAHCPERTPTRDRSPR